MHTDSNSYSQASSRANNNKPTRNFLIDDAPKSYRSTARDLPEEEHKTFVNPRHSVEGDKVSKSEIKADEKKLLSDDK